MKKHNNKNITQLILLDALILACGLALTITGWDYFAGIGGLICGILGAYVIYAGK